MDTIYNLRPITSSTDLRGSRPPGSDKVLTAEALDFVAKLASKFTGRIEELLTLRRVVQSRYDAGLTPRFRPETRHIREFNWTCAEQPEDLVQRRVEITGPVDRKMIIGGLNSGADVFMADFEDSTSPTWTNIVAGQINLYDAARRDIAFTHPISGKVYSLCADPATLFVRPRGLHLWEAHVQVAGKAVPAGLFDFALHFFHNADELIARGSGPYFYLPKLESRLEARLWNEVFVLAQRLLDIPQGTIKATVLIETLPAAFEMDEILFELREHSAGLNCGRWDYIFSYIKTFREHAGRVLPDRDQLDMTQPFMTAYTQLVVKTCHRRGVHAMGGMAAQIPIKGDSVANEAALDQVRQDKLREVRGGHDGTWVAHPALVPIAMEVFDSHLAGANQLGHSLSDVVIREDQLLAPPSGTLTLAGLRENIAVGLCYLAAWLGGKGCVALNHLMEDAATAEISRSQVWQCVRHAAELEDGQVVSEDLVTRILAEELLSLQVGLQEDSPEAEQAVAAADLLGHLVTSPHFHEFLTLPAYERIRRDRS